MLGFLLPGKVVPRQFPVVLGINTGFSFIIFRDNAWEVLYFNTRMDRRFNSMEVNRFPVPCHSEIDPSRPELQPPECQILLTVRYSI
jgi:hypothetical protein